MFKKKTPSKKEVKELIEKAEEMAKTKKKKDSQEKEEASLAKKLDLMLKKVDKIDSIKKTLKEIKVRTDKLEAVVGATNPKDKSTKKKPTNEELLAQAQAEQEKAQGKQQAGQQAGQAQGKLTPEEQKVIGATQQFQRDIATAKAGQEQAQQQGQQPQPGQVLTPQGAWLLERGAHAAEIILPALFQSKGSSGNPLEGFFKELKIYQSIENSVLSGFFNYMKLLSPGQRTGIMNGIHTAPPRPTMIDLSSKSELIE